MTLLYYDPIFLEHDTGNHPECAARIVPIVELLSSDPVGKLCERARWQPVSLERLARVHSLPYAETVQRFAAGGGGRIEADTTISGRSYDAALMAAGAVCDAVKRVVRGDAATAFCLVRPPGHHALSEEAMGFCLFNNIAIGSRLATTEFGLSRVLIVDWDVHHGNGTQATFWEDPRVGFLSIHRWPFYPGTGAVDETGGRDGLGTTVNLPVSFGTQRGDYLSQFESALHRIADQMKPELVMISAGFDSHHADPIGSLGLENEDFAALTTMVLEVAKAHANGRVVSVLEGGYNPAALTECVKVHLETLQDRQDTEDAAG